MLRLVDNIILRICTENKRKLVTSVEKQTSETLIVVKNSDIQTFIDIRPFCNFNFRFISEIIYLIGLYY